MARAAAVTNPRKTELDELEDWIARLSMRGVGPAFIAALDGRLLAATRTDQVTGEASQLASIAAAIQKAAPGDIIHFGCLE
jgi:hypothetical protein